MASMLSGTSFPWETRAPEPTIAPSPTLALSRTIAPMPTRTLLPMVAPWTIAPWEMMVSSPILTGEPVGASTTQFSRTVVLAPISTVSSSPLMMAPVQMLEPSPMVTSPMTQEPGARNTES